jgi:hypothetical protein
MCLHIFRYFVGSVRALSFFSWVSHIMIRHIPLDITELQSMGHAFPLRPVTEGMPMPMFFVFCVLIIYVCVYIYIYNHLDELSYKI